RRVGARADVAARTPSNYEGPLPRRNRDDRRAAPGSGRSGRCRSPVRPGPLGILDSPRRPRARGGGGDMVSSRRISGSILIAIAALAAGPAGCRKETKSERAPIPVRAETVAPAGAAGGVRYSANVQPREQVPLAFKSSGYVREIR